MFRKSLTRNRIKMLIVLTAVKLLFFLFLLQAKAGDYSDSSFVTEGTGQSTCYSFLPQVAQDKESEIENWMIDPNDPFWQEKEIELENWMYEIHYLYNDQTVAAEAELPIEMWMLNPSAWKLNSEVIAGITR